MSNGASHKVLVVEEREGAEPGDEKKGYWTTIGRAWPHKDGRGLNVVLSALPIGNRMVLREYDADDERPAEPRGKAKAKSSNAGG